MQANISLHHGISSKAHAQNSCMAGLIILSASLPAEKWALNASPFSQQEKNIGASDHLKTAWFSS